MTPSPLLDTVCSVTASEALLTGLISPAAMADCCTGGTSTNLLDRHTVANCEVRDIGRPPRGDVVAVSFALDEMSFPLPDSPIDAPRLLCARELPEGTRECPEAVISPFGLVVSVRTTCFVASCSRTVLARAASACVPGKEWGSGSDPVPEPAAVLRVPAKEDVAAAAASDKRKH